MTNTCLRVPPNRRPGPLVIVHASGTLAVGEVRVAERQAHVVQHHERLLAPVVRRPPGRHRSRSFSALLSVCCISTARSFNASRCAGAAPPFRSSTSSSSGQAHPPLYSLFISWPLGLRSMAADSNTCAPATRSRFSHGSAEHPRHVTRTG